MESDVDEPGLEHLPGVSSGPPFTVYYKPCMCGAIDEWRPEFDAWDAKPEGPEPRPRPHDPGCPYTAAMIDEDGVHNYRNDD